MKFFRHFCAACRFLTVFPLPGTFGADGEDLKGSLPYFPIVGILLGLAAGGAAWLAWELFPPSVAAVILTLVLLSFSGALHLDGLADCADGFFSARDRARMLEIMRDSRIGVMGVVAVFAVLLLKICSLSSLSQNDAVRAAMLMPLAGRAALVVMIFLLPYVRKEGGLGSPFYASGSSRALAVSLVLFLGIGGIFLRLKGITAAIAVLMTVFIFSRYCHRKIGGTTGDCLGAACELAEMVTALFLLPDFFV